MPSDRIAEIGVSHVPVSYRKELGKNAYADNIGTSRSEWIVRARTDGGLEGLTIANSYMRRDGSSVDRLVDTLREALLGQPVDGLLEIADGRAAGVGSAVRRAVDANPWMSVLAFDLAARGAGTSCVELLGGRKRDRVDAYDTTFYFQDLVESAQGPQAVAEEVAAARADGYRQAKLKVGRGGRWMLPKPGMRRDVEVVLAVREAVGRDFTINVDANFGYDGHLDLLEEFFRAVAPAEVYWFEEMVTADVEHYRAMRRMQQRYAPNSLLVCGEVDRNPISPVFQQLIDNGLIDGYQPDVVFAGYARWMEIESRLEGTTVRSIPHNFGNGRLGTRATAVFGAASETFVSLEDERQHDHVYSEDGFVFEDGAYMVPDVAGLGLEIDRSVFDRDFATDEVVIK